jgi:hypothetical protein
MANYQFRRGYYYMAGVDKPWFLSTSMIIDEVEDMGFRVLSVGECEKWGMRGQMPFPTGGNQCGDQYDWVGLAERVGPDEVIDLPSQVKWIQGWPKPAQWPPQPPQPGEPPPPPQPPPQPPAPPYIAPPTPMEDKGNGAAPGQAAVAPGDVDWRIPAVVAGAFGGLLLARWWADRRRR